MVKPLVEFVASLHKNRTDDRTLQRCCQASIRGDVVSIRIEFNEEGQYGLDIYTRYYKYPFSWIVVFFVR